MYLKITIAGQNSWAGFATGSDIYYTGNIKLRLILRKYQFLFNI